jgi:capsular polysaccharide biosynthesis protein
VLSEGVVFRADGTVVSATAEFTKPSALARAAAEFDENRKKARLIDEHALLAMRPGGNCYGHLVTEVMGSAWAAASVLGDRPFSLLIEASTPGVLDVYTEIARCAGLLARPIINEREHEPVRVKKLYVVEGFALTDRYLSPLLADFAREVVNSCATSGPATRKLYVPRHDGQGRVATNEAEVWRELEARGFELVRPETLAWTDQVRLFAQASHMVGPMGSGLANALFSPAGSRLLTLAPACMGDSFFWRVSGIVGVDYEEIRCPTVDSPGYQRTKRPQDRDIVVDLKAVLNWADGVAP